MLERDGVADDVDAAASADLVARRLHIAGGERRCCGTETEFVAVDPADPSLPPGTAAALRELAPGRAIASLGLAELVGGFVAVPGVDIGVAASADLGGHVVAITFDDAVAMLRAPGAERMDIRTAAIVRAGGEHRFRSWRTVATGLADVPLTGHAGCGHDGSAQ